MPVSTTTEGRSMSSSTSLSTSSAHMPRVILRTVEPAKLLACQSLEKRCTRWKASRTTSAMMPKVSGTTPHQARCRSTTITSPSPAIMRKASSAAGAASRPWVSASMRRPAKSGTKISVSVAATMATAMPAAIGQRRAQWRNVKARTLRSASAPCRED